MSRVAAIIGGGVIGGGWAARFVLNGWDVQVYDPDPEAERKIGEVMANARRSLPGLTDVALPAEGKLTFHSSIAEAVAAAGRAVEHHETSTYPRATRHRQDTPPHAESRPPPAWAGRWNHDRSRSPQESLRCEPCWARGWHSR